MKPRLTALVIGLLTVFVGSFPQAMAKHPDYHEIMKNSSEAETQSLDTLKFWDSEGQAFSMSQWRGRLVLIEFFFTSCPNICPVQTAGLARTWEKLDPSVRASLVIVSMSLDPRQDTPEKLLEYRQRFGIKASNWIFASGKEDDVLRLARHLGAVSPGRSALEHRPRLYLLNPEGRFVSSFASAPTIDSEKLARELSRAVRSLIGT